MSPESPAGARSSGLLITAAVLAVIVGIVYLVEPAKSLPSILGTITHPRRRADANRPLRGTAALLAGAICLVAAWLVSRQGKSSPR